MFQKGHILSRGNKGGGRKTKLAEIKIAVDEIKEKITHEALIELANSKVYKFLNKAESHIKVKELGLPITLKSMPDKKQIEVDFSLAELLKKQNEDDRRTI